MELLLSKPDIELLAPVERLLDISLDTLLSFHEKSLLVRHSNDGKLYLYDIIDIKKKRATLSANNRLPDKKPISFSK